MSYFLYPLARSRIPKVSFPISSRPVGALRPLASTGSALRFSLLLAPVFLLPFSFLDPNSRRLFHALNGARYNKMLLARLIARFLLMRGGATSGSYPLLTRLEMYSGFDKNLIGFISPSGIFRKT